MSNSVPVGLGRVSTQYQTKVYNKQSSICIDCSMTCMNCIQHKSTLFPCKECKVAPSVPCVAPPRGSKSKCLYCKLNSEPFAASLYQVRLVALDSVALYIIGGTVKRRISRKYSQLCFNQSLLKQYSLYFP